VETVAGFTDHDGQVVVEVGCGIGIDGSRFALLAWPWFNRVATQAVFTRFGGIRCGSSSLAHRRAACACSSPSPLVSESFWPAAIDTR
jgi:hypothetical protein